VLQSSKTLLVLGATSDIGRAMALAFAQAGWTIQLAGRDLTALRREADDIAARTGVPVTLHAFDVLQTEVFAAFIDALSTLPDTVVCFVGLLGDQARAQTDIDHATTIMRSNYEGPSLILGQFAERFIARGSGTIVGVSSVAGDRGRGSNYVYGSAKAGFTAFLSGLRNRCATSNVRIITVKPGYVRTSMTAGMKLPAALTVDARTAGEAIVRAVNTPRDVVYVSRIWRLVMAIIALIPESIFKRLKI
jgi:decaprenylphospho-beta-D-erythro-pentofuranosid-2-ulose 2-reductase